MPDPACMDTEACMHFPCHGINFICLNAMYTLMYSYMWQLVLHMGV